MILPKNWQKSQKRDRRKPLLLPKVIIIKKVGNPITDLPQERVGIPFTDLSQERVGIPISYWDPNLPLW
jgi:hypothetical protein